MSSGTSKGKAVHYLVLQCDACLEEDAPCREPCQLVVPYGEGDEPAFLEQKVKEERLRCMLDECNSKGWKIVERIVVNQESL